MLSSAGMTIDQAAEMLGVQAGLLQPFAVAAPLVAELFAGEDPVARFQKLRGELEARNVRLSDPVSRSGDLKATH